MRSTLGLVFIVVVLALPGTTTAQAGGAAPRGGSAETVVTGVSDEAEFRQAVIDLSADPNGPHTITLDNDILLDDGSDPTYSSVQPLTIEGQGHSIKGDGSSRVLVEIANSPLLTIRDLTIGGGRVDGTGGAISWGGPVTVENSVLFDNAATGAGLQFGGAIFAQGDVIITDSVLRDNKVTSTGTNANGGAVYTSGAGSGIVVTGSAVTNNTATAAAAASAAGGPCSPLTP